MNGSKFAVDYIPFPNYLWHTSPKKNRKSILKDGLIGKNNGEWCIYLSHLPDSWIGLYEDYDLYKVLTENLIPNDFTSIDSNMDETMYWGKINGKISIPKENVIPIYSN